MILPNISVLFSSILPCTHLFHQWSTRIEQRLICSVFVCQLATGWMPKPYKWNKYACRVVASRVKPIPTPNRVNNKVWNIPADSATRTKRALMLVARTITIYPAVVVVVVVLELKRIEREYFPISLIGIMFCRIVTSTPTREWMKWTETKSFSNWNIVNSRIRTAMQPGFELLLH